MKWNFKTEHKKKDLSVFTMELREITNSVLAMKNESYSLHYEINSISFIPPVMCTVPHFRDVTAVWNFYTLCTMNSKFHLQIFYLKLPVKNNTSVIYDILFKIEMFNFHLPSIIMSYSYTLTVKLNSCTSKVDKINIFQASAISETFSLFFLLQNYMLAFISFSFFCGTQSTSSWRGRPVRNKYLLLWFYSLLLDIILMTYSLEEFFLQV